MVDFIKNESLVFDNKELNELLKILNSCFETRQSNFVDICCCISKICDCCRGHYFKAKDNEYYNCYKLLEKFGFDRKAVSCYKNCFKRFVIGFSFDDVELSPRLVNFSPSKLFELLPLSDETIFNAIDTKVLKPEMTVKEIRQFVKSQKNGQTTETVVENKIEINEEEIPFVYDPQNEYEYSYFESKTKNQLLNIVWELQKAYQKLVKKETKKSGTKK